ncbi:hypothetical protein [Gorillibacterium timonense]|uniref:hypothetical protein n=1 Tax=Gorillibacterium timonense TaxID=1689269 RepID=UPI00071D0610|nr:hypothetical protein [Gorillibacterium timonense]
MSQKENETAQATEQEKAEAIGALFTHCRNMLLQSFDGSDVEGQVGEHPLFGPLFIFTLKLNQQAYSCGFLVGEVARTMQNNPHPEVWISSFFVDMVREGTSRPLPSQPSSEEESKAFVEQKVLPACANGIREEFTDRSVHLEVVMHPEYGPILEAGFPEYKDGSNTAGLPIHFLFTLYLLNRDPAEPVIEALYRVLSEQEAVEAH